MNNKIDIVILWVDGGDTAWQADKAKYQPENSKDGANRYRDWGLLKYWFRGIEKFAPWVNKVHFITWGHLPEWLNTDCEKLNIVYHKDFIPEKYLPTFSSHTIELNLHRIEDLQERFVYFNDDMYLINKTTVEDFFIDGLPVDDVRETALTFNPGGIDYFVANNVLLINKNFKKREVVKQNASKWFSLKAPKSALKNLYMLPIGQFSSFGNPHLANSLLKSTYEEVWGKEPEALENTSSHRFRDNFDINQWVIRYWQFAKGNFVQRAKPTNAFFSIGKDNEAIKNVLLNGKLNMVCINDDTENLDFQKEQKFMEELFKKRLPEKSIFEK